VSLFLHPFHPPLHHLPFIPFFTTPPHKPNTL
jgi:hypothetical protein